MNDFQKQVSKNILGCYSNTSEFIKSEERTFNKDLLPEMLEKGEISSALSSNYGVDVPIKFTKKGKEIKEKIPGILAILNAEKANLIAQMAILQSTIGIDPTEQITSKLAKDLNLMRYPWSMIDAPYDSMSQSYSEKTEVNINCDKYNNLCWMLRDIAEDAAALEVLQANMKDGDSYTLSVNQLIALNVQ